ncbi:RNA binding protein, putative [Ricinus communis]|uniref:RNA binding protein, putative n=1 Tax=Ricinus communis TaxID=3988 RepID=B9R735_RICCO|nr:RNA binding protein, putative [Ricinus communis]|eukprot:XP_002510128.1 pumilio homolog 12 [Ricinus communis]
MARENGNFSFPSQAPPLDSYIYNPRNSSFLHLNQRRLLPQISTPDSPYHDSVETLFSRLSISRQNSQHTFHGDGEAFLGSVLDRSYVSSQDLAFLDQDMGQNLYNNNGVNSCASLGLQDYGSTTTNIWDNFISDSVLSSNVNGLFRADSRRGGFSNGLMLKTTQDSLSPGLHSRRPYWLQQEPSNNNYYSSLRSGGGGSNVDDIIPLPLENLMGRIARYAKDQFGCKLVRKALENVTHEKIDMVLLEIIDSVAELMPHPFGNYVVQKLVEVCSEEQRTRILLAVTKNEVQLVSICLNMHGTRAVQKLLEGIASTQQVSITARQQVSLIMSALSSGAVELAKDMNGHHVIKYCLEHFLPEDNKYLLKVVADNCFDIATDKSGCCVLQQCVDHSMGEPRDRLVASITNIALRLAQDRYGNYVIQHLLGLRNPLITANLFRQLEGYFAVLSCDKFGSNVVEKCLLESRAEQCTQIISELLRSPCSSMLLVDPYGNFVIQSALKVSKGLVQGAMLELIRQNIPAMRSSIYGRKLLAWLHKERLLPM